MKYLKSILKFIIYCCIWIIIAIAILALATLLTAGMKVAMDTLFNFAL